jgi:hypothetical protein
LYFSGLPPFAANEKKKAEFPDAACLVMLESYAREYNTQGIVASDDRGWKDFAAESEHIYCVGSIDELANLFAATGEIANSVRDRIVEAINDPASPLRKALEVALGEHISNSNWHAEDAQVLFSGRVESEVVEAVMANYELNNNSVSVWAVQGDQASWVIELAAEVDACVVVDVAKYMWDWIDKDELLIGTDSFDKSIKVPVEAFLQCSGVTLEGDISSWDVTVDCQYQEYSVEVGEVELDHD